MKYFIEERKTCRIEANSEEEALHKYYNGEGHYTDSDIDIIACLN